MEPMVSEEMNGGNNTDQNQKDGTNNKDSGTKCCADCKTTKTPLWRAGPSGPKSLCNACGIRYRKKRASLGSSSSPSTTSSDRKRERPPQPPHVSCPAASDVGKGLGESARMSMSLVLLGKDFVVPTSAVAKKQRCQRKRKLGEEELAAVSLMALSCGSVFA